MARHVCPVVVEFSVLGEPVTGEWCDPCALPSLVHVPGLLTVARTTTLATLKLCTDCGRTSLERDVAIA